MRIWILLIGLLITSRVQAQEPTVCAKDRCVVVEIARTQEQLTKGLMDRESLAKNHGMLFVFDRDDYHTFWMKNMRFAIDIIWLDHEGVIVDIVDKALPCTNAGCPSLRPIMKARYVFEINAGHARKFRWSEGDKLIFKKYNGVKKDFERLLDEE